MDAGRIWKWLLLWRRRPRFLSNGKALIRFDAAACGDPQFAATREVA